MQERTGGDHLGVEQRVAREQAVKVTAMPFGPVHHRCNRQFTARKLLI
jgi:hypothetical protein